MMGEDNGTRWQSLPPFLMLLLLAVGSFWWIPWPLQGERPPQSAVGIQVEGVQQAAGRLWQDPFAVVQRYREGGPSVQAKGRDLSWLAGVAAEKCTEKTPCRLLGVMVFGSPYVGGEDWRRNKRYAVLAGLSRHGFIPEDTEHIGFVEQESGLPPVLPFEWLQREGTDEKKERVLLLWLDEDALTRELYDPTSGGLHSAILPRLQQLLEPLNVPGMQGLDILGPSSSGTLSKLASELKTAPQEQEPSGGEVPLLRSAHWYSASATSDKAWKETTGKPGPLPITRVIAKDSKLAEMLVQELKRRGLKSQDTVALVGQLDTAYSRNLINLLHKGLEENFRPPERIQVITVHYLRGIDGEKPGDGKGSDRNGDKKKTGNAESREEQVERPEGDSQIDYLRRLTVWRASTRHSSPRGRFGRSGSWETTTTTSCSCCGLCATPFRMPSSSRRTSKPPCSIPSTTEARAIWWWPAPSVWSWSLPFRPASRPFAPAIKPPLTWPRGFPSHSNHRARAHRSCPRRRSTSAFLPCCSRSAAQCRCA